MQRIARNPYLAFPLAAAVAMALLVGWSLLLSNRLTANNAFAVFFLLIPLLAALYCFSGWARASGGRWIVKWLGTSVLGLLASGVVGFASIALIPFKALSTYTYNYPHFNVAVYPTRGGGSVRPGEQAADGTVYTLDENPVRLADLWKEKPVVIEVGSIT